MPPSLRRSQTSTATARASTAPYAHAAALSWSSSSSSSTRTATQQRRVSDPTQTKSRRVLADIDWWLVHDGQVDADNTLSEDEGLDENLEATNGDAARPPMAVASLPQVSPEPEWLRRVRDGEGSTNSAQVCLTRVYSNLKVIPELASFPHSSRACRGFKFALPCAVPHRIAIASIARAHPRRSSRPPSQ
ncbi:hypothetical protein PENSPDRAFT_398528 [Peniophora sp. CONT]|nr:hypothetical protein PENSPDRAFT_398528 [Peniophora sp. CONT]